MVIEKLRNIGIVPVIALDDAALAVDLATSLQNGGISAVEITFRTKEAKQVINNIKNNTENIVIGAGTVTTYQHVDDAINNGAQFIVSPGLNANIVKYCQDKDILIIPGVNNPTQIEQALELGLTNVKFFPAEPSGGINMIKALAAPYGNINFMPTGGVSPNNLADYLSFDRIVACGGSWMVPNAAIEAKNFALIEKLALDAVAKMLDIKLKLPNNMNGDMVMETKQFQRAVYHLQNKGAKVDMIDNNKANIVTDKNSFVLEGNK